MGGIYNGQCGQRDTSLSFGAIRIRNTVAIDNFTDVLMGNVQTNEKFAAEDFILKRSDGLFAYQLAVVLDDAYQGMTEIVRGCDLLEATVRQMSLYKIFGLKSPRWFHLPLASLEHGFKLSKQNHATPIDKNHPQAAIQTALVFLGQPSVENDKPEKMLIQAIEQFDINAIPKKHEVLIKHGEHNA